MQAPSRPRPGGRYHLIERVVRWVRDLTLIELMSVAIVVVLVGVAVALVGDAVDGFRAQYSGIAGRVTVEDCQWQNTKGGGGWECSGLFVSDDGATRIAGVTLDPWFDERPAESLTVAAVVSGQLARVARTEDNRWLLPGLAAVAFAGMAIWLAWPLGQDVRLSRDLEQPSAERAAPARREPSVPPAAPPHVLAGVPRANLAIWKILGGWLVLVAAITGFLWTLAQWNREQDALLSTTVAGTVIADRLGADSRIEIAFLDGDGTTRSVRLTPYDAGRFPVGREVWLRYDPARPEQAVPVDTESFELPPRDRNMWAGMLLLPGIVLAWAWTWRLGRWGLGALRRGVPATVRVRVAQLQWGTEPAALWLVLHGRGGGTWYQRVIWDRRLVDRLETVMRGTDGAATVQTGLPLEASLRRCPGLRRMYLVDVAGVGRLWPASTARRRPPHNYHLGPFIPDLAGPGESARRHVGVVVVLAVLATVGWLAGGPGGSVYVLALIVGYQRWGGAVPWRGLYAYRPA